MSVRKTLAVVGITIFLTVIGLYQCVTYQLTPIRQTIATDLVVDGQWQEVSISNPLKPWRQVQHVTLNVDGYSHQHDPPSGPFRVTLPDGTVAKPEVQIVDERGNTLVLEDDLRLGDTIGFSPQIGGFPSDQKYVMIRLRSDVPIKVTKLGWIDMNLK